MTSADPVSIRQRLVDAASAVIDELGEERLTLALVCGRAGLTTGAVYSNFDNREELVVAVYLDRYAGRMWEGVDRFDAFMQSDLHGDAFVRELADQVIRPDDPTFRTSRWLRLRALAATQRYEQVRSAVSDLQRQIAERLTEIVARAQARGDVVADRDPRAIAFLLQQFGFTLVLFDLSGDAAPDPDEWVALARDLLVPLFPGRVGSAG